MKNIKTIRKTLFFIYSVIAILVMSTKLGYTADIGTLTSTFTDLLENVGSIVKIIIRFAMWIALISVVYRYIKNKGEWEEMGRWTIGAIIIGVSNEVLAAFIGY
ncbi:MAG: TrbC/VirB2 family protein [Rickettsiales bacterium]|nr:TrbC/VirB2 family protein [Rickettsiales bacterium]